jgi:hypothetical protein
MAGRQNWARLDVQLASSKSSMPYLPTLRLNFPGGISNEYRLRDGRTELRIGDGSWRILDHADLHLHMILGTEVAKWLRKQSENTSRTGSH